MENATGEPFGLRQEPRVARGLAGTLVKA